MSIADNIERVRGKIAEAALRSGRRPGDVRLMAVTKTVGVDDVREAISAGVSLFGENRVQDARPKIDALPDLEWHMIGHLQTNKVGRAVDLFRTIQSVDSIRLAREIDRRAGAKGKPMPVLLEVNVSGEESKYGLGPGDVEPFLRDISGFENLRVEGFMTMAPFVDDPEDVRPVFRALRELRDRIRSIGIPGIFPDVLSMGMTQDFEVAVEEGSTLVRVGTAVFGGR